MKKLKQFTRKELLDIRQRAYDLQRDDPNPNWKRAYNKLGDGADWLDSLLARAGVPYEEKKVKRGKS